MPATQGHRRRRGFSSAEARGGFGASSLGCGRVSSRGTSASSRATGASDFIFKTVLPCGPARPSFNYGQLRAEITRSSDSRNVLSS